MANEQSEKKVIAALAPFCVEQFLKSADATQSAELLKLTTNYERGSLLEKGGWTSVPRVKETNWGVGRACGDLLAAAAKKYIGAITRCMGRLTPPGLDLDWPEHGGMLHRLGLKVAGTPGLARIWTLRMIIVPAARPLPAPQR